MYSLRSSETHVLYARALDCFVHRAPRQMKPANKGRRHPPVTARTSLCSGVMHHDLHAPEKNAPELAFTLTDM